MIAHSFGTYIVSRTLEQYPSTKLDRLILCGSIIHKDFDCETLLGSRRVLWFFRSRRRCLRKGLLMRRVPGGLSWHSTTPTTRTSLTISIVITIDDWTHIAPNGIVRRGRVVTVQALRQAHATFLKGVTDTPEDVDVRLATPDVAIGTVRSRSSAFTAPNGVRNENQSRIRTFVVVKRDGRWLIMQDQNTAQPQTENMQIT